MLNARFVPKVCHSCHLEVLSVFTNGILTRPIVRDGHLRRFQPGHERNIRGFGTTHHRRNVVANALSDGDNDIKAPSGINSVVRQARQTFGETLPKDYLSTDEYALYERLYGPPLRETRAEDLEYIPEDALKIDDKAIVRDVLLRVNDEGEFEEVEFDAAQGFKIHASAEDDLAAVRETIHDVMQSPQGSVMADVGTGVLQKRDERSRFSEGQEGRLTSTAELGSQLGETSSYQIRQPEDLIVQGQNQREVNAIARLQKDMDAALAKSTYEENGVEEECEEEDDDVFEEEQEEDYEQDEGPGYISSDTSRTHPHTMTGRFGTFPSTLSLPKRQMLDPVTELLERTNMKHLQESAERTLGGKGIPFSPSTRSLKGPSPQKHVGLDASQHKMSELEADTYLAAVMPQTYTVVLSALVEVRKRLGRGWLRDLLFKEGGEGARVLDAGGGGAGAIAWQEMLQAEWEVLEDEGIVEGNYAQTGKTTVLTGSASLRNRVSRFLDNTTFLPRLPDYVHSARPEALLDGAPAQGRKTFDVIIAPHTLFPLKEDFKRKNMVENLWSLLDPSGGVLVLIEKGVPRGFEAIANARAQLLRTRIKSPNEEPPQEQLVTGKENRIVKEAGMIIAPCTNHTTCPMYPVPGLSSGRKDFCHFGQRFIRPSYLQRILGASVRNHEDVNFSYIAVRRGVDARLDPENPVLQGEEATRRAFQGYENTDLAGSEEVPATQDGVKFNPLSLPRSILPALKRRGHVTMDLCTPSGQLERWTVPKSFSKAAHRDARKTQWGDLWALGAKTRTARPPRLGRLGKEASDGSTGQATRSKKIRKFDIIMGHDGMEGIKPARNHSRLVTREKRTKGGRIWKLPKPIGEDDL